MNGTLVETSPAGLPSPPGNGPPGHVAAGTSPADLGE